MRKLYVVLMVIFVVGSVWAEFERYVIDTKVGAEEFANVEVVEEVSSKAVGCSVSWVLEDTGIYLQNRGVFGIQSDLTIRGSRFNQTSVAVNGVVMNDIQSGHLNLSLPITIYDVGVLGVQKSGNSTIYGSDAIGGVVDFKFWDVPEENVKIKLYSGDYGLIGSVASVSRGFGPIGIRLSFDRKRSDGYRFNTDFDTWIANLTLLSKFYGFDALAFVGHLEKFYGASKFYRTEAREREIVTMSMFALSKDNFKFNVFYKRSLDNYTVNIVVPNSQVNTHNKASGGVDIQNTFSFGDLGNLFVKLEGRWNVIDSVADIGGVVTNLLGNRYDIPFAVVGEYGIMPLEALSLALGLRADFWYVGDRRYGIILSPSFKSYYYLLPSLKVSGSANRFFRVPTYVELYYYDGVAFGNTNLLPEEGWNYELNLSYFFDRGKKTFAYISGFWRDSLNVIDFADDKTIPGIRYEATNIRWISGGGVEVGLNFDTTMLLNNDGKVKVFYAYAKFDSGVPLNFTFRYDKYLEHQLNVSVLQKFGRLELYLLTSLRNRFEGRDSAGNLLPYTTYTLVNGRLAWEVLSGCKVFVEGYNLGDVGYEDISGVKMPGRWIWAGMEFNMM
ncbi:MAG: TonB-dependent receptor [Brevinematia bacterium]